MTKLFQNFDQFKDVTLSISKHLKNIKVGVLREAVAKSQGYANVPALKASLDDLPSSAAVGAGEPNPNIPDPNVTCYIDGDFLIFQGRIDWYYAEEGEEMAEVDESVTAATWPNLSTDQKLEWQEHASFALIGTDDTMLAAMIPFEVNGALYARGHLLMGYDSQIEEARKFVHYFLATQMAKSPLLMAVEVMHHLTLESEKSNDVYLKGLVKKINGFGHPESPDQMLERPFELRNSIRNRLFVHQHLSDAFPDDALKAYGGDVTALVKVLVPDSLYRSSKQKLLTDMYPENPFDSIEREEHAVLNDALDAVAKAVEFNAQLTLLELAAFGTEETKATEKSVVDLINSKRCIISAATDLVLGAPI